MQTGTANDFLFIPSINYLFKPMPLILRIHTYRKQAPATPVEKSFDPLGGTIGRGPGNDLVLNDDSKFISRTHCKIDFRDGGYFLTDLGSNPSLINQRPVGNGKQVRIGHGDVLDIGEYQLNAIVADAGGAAANPLPLSPLSAAPALARVCTAMRHQIFTLRWKPRPACSIPWRRKNFGCRRWFGGHVGANHDPLGLGGEPVLDPLADPLFGRPGAAKPHPGAFIGSENDHLAAQHMPMPAFQPLIPDDFLAPLPASAPVPASANPAAAIRPVQTFIPDDFDLLAPAPAPRSGVFGTHTCSHASASLSARGFAPEL